MACMGGIFSAQDDGAAPSRAVLLPGAREDVEAAVQDLMQETRCPICLDFFTNPRSAPCQHNFCEECIWEYIKDSHSECPTCRNPGTNRRSLSRNNQLRNITDQVKRLANALGLASPEEPLLSGGNDSKLVVQESAWGNGQKQAEKHVGRRHAKGRKGGALKGDKTNGGDGQSRDARAETSASSDDYLGGRQMDLYATPAPLSKNADGGVHIEGLERRLAGSELAATPGEGRQAMSARATAAKGERGGAPAGNGDGEGGVCADEPKGTAGAHDWHERTINDAALAAALAGYNPGGLRKRREVHRDEIARAGSALGSSRVHSPEEDGASDSKRPRPAGGLGGQATCVDVASAGAAELDGKRVVVTFTGFKGADSIALHTKILHLGGTYAPHFHVGVTHVVCACDAQRRTQRTFKYSMGLVSGSVLVTPAWVHACRSQGSWREPWQDEHFVTGSVVHGEEHPGPNQRVSCPEPIFSGKCFYLAGTFVPPNPSREEVTLLLKAGGATVVQQQPNLRTIIALCGDDLEETTYQHLRTMQATMVTPAFVMDSISLYGLQDVGDYRYEP